MIRIFTETHNVDFNTDTNEKTHNFVDIECPELEKLLTSGGMGEQGFCKTQVISAKVIDRNESLTASRSI